MSCKSSAEQVPSYQTETEGFSKKNSQDMNFFRTICLILQPQNTQQTNQKVKSKSKLCAWSTHAGDFTYLGWLDLLSGLCRCVQTVFDWRRPRSNYNFIILISVMTCHNSKRSSAYLQLSRRLISPLRPSIWWKQNSLHLCDICECKFHFVGANWRSLLNPRELTADRVHCENYTCERMSV